MKGRIVHWGHRDVEEDEVRGDAPSINLDAARISILIHIEHTWPMRNPDVIPAYLEVKKFTRTIFVRPLKDENDRKALWKLLVPAHCFTDSDLSSYLISYEALSRRIAFMRFHLRP